MSAKSVRGRLRSGYSAEPLPLDYESTVVMVNIMKHDVGGIYCISGRDVLPIGAKIWDDTAVTPNEDAGWEVKRVLPHGQGEEVVDHIKWRPHSFNVSQSQLTRGMITAAVPSDTNPEIPETFNCYRALTVVNSIEGEGEPPEFTGEVIPNGYVGIPYNHQLTAEGDSPFIWSVKDPLPAGLRLDKNSGVISGTPTTNTARKAYDTYVQNVYGMACGPVTFGIYDAHTLVIEVDPTKTYVVGTAIPPEDLTISYLGQVIPMETTSQRGYTLIYNKDKGVGKQTVTVAYDPVAEEIGEPALGYFEAEYVAARQG